MMACQMLSLSVGAATIESVSTDSGYVFVQGTSNEDMVTYKIYSDGSSGNLVSDICEMGEASVNDGRFLIEVKLPKYVNGVEMDGDYVVKVMGETADSGEFYVVAHSSLTGFVGTINGDGITTAADLVRLFGESQDGGYTNMDIMRNLGADADYYAGLEPDEKTMLAEAFLSEKGQDWVSIENFSALFSNAKKVQYINKNRASAEWFDENGFAFEGVKFSEIANNDLKAKILASVNGVITETRKYNTCAEIEKKYREANVLYKLNTAKFTEYEEIIALYDDIIEITGESYYRQYVDMKPLSKNSVNSEIKNSIAKKQITNSEEFRNIFEDAVEKVIKANDDKKGGGGGGGSSSGITVIPPEITNPTNVKTGFSDLEGSEWAKDAVAKLAEHGVIAGYDDNTFKPQKNITREEFIKMVVVAQGISLNVEPCGLADVDQSKWYAPYVNAAYQAGIIKGVSESEFGIGKEITREDMAVIIARIKNYGNVTEEQNVFADVDEISSYAKDAVYSLYGAGKIAGIGDNMFGPKLIVTRAQAAKIIYDTLLAGIL